MSMEFLSLYNGEGHELVYPAHLWRLSVQLHGLRLIAEIHIYEYVCIKTLFRTFVYFLEINDEMEK